MIDQELLNAARSVLTSFGVEKATLERIAAEAGLSRVTLHRRGLTKELLLEALTEQAVDDFQHALWPALTATGSGRERLEHALTALCEVADANLGIVTALGSRTDAVFHEDGDGALTRGLFTDPFARLLADGAADGTLRECDPAETATVLFNLVGWTYIHLRARHRWSAERARYATLELALNGVAARSAG